MKKTPFRLFGYGILMAAAITVSSCKDREKDATDSDTGNEINGEIYGKGTPADNEAGNLQQNDTTSGTGVDNPTGTGAGTGGTGSGSGSGSGTGSGGSGTSGSGSGSSSTGSTSGSSGTSGSSASTGYGDSNDPLENSSTPSVTKKGQAVASSGSSGSGMGTGTGSTGNNSKVTRRSDQLRQ